MVRSCWRRKGRDTRLSGSEGKREDDGARRRAPREGTREREREALRSPNKDDARGDR